MILARILLALALLIAPAVAQTQDNQYLGGTVPILNGCRSVVCSGTIGNFPLPSATTDMDFANNRTFGCATFAACVTTNSPGVYATNADGSLTFFGANVLPIGVGTGLLAAEETRTNLALQSGSLTTAPWGPNGGSVVASTTAVVSPTGSGTYTQVVFGSTSNNSIGQVFTTPASTTFAVSVWAVTTSGTGSFRLGIFDGTTIFRSVDLMATTAPQRFTANITTGASATGSGSVFVGQQSSNLTSTVLFFGFQIEQAAFPTSYIPTTTAAVTRAAYTTAPTGNLQTLLNALERSVVMSMGVIPSVVNLPTPLQLNSVSASTNIGARVATATTAIIRAASVDTTATMGSGSFTTTSSKIGSSWGSSGDSIVINNGTVATSTNVMVPSANIQIGSSDATTRQINGYIQRLTTWNTRLSDPTLKGFTQ